MTNRFVGVDGDNAHAALGDIDGDGDLDGVCCGGSDGGTPENWSCSRFEFAINDGTAVGIGNNHPGGANVAMCDGSVHFLSDGTSPNQVEAMSTIDGGEVVNPNF